MARIILVGSWLARNAYGTRASDAFGAMAQARAKGVPTLLVGMARSLGLASSLAAL